MAKKRSQKQQEVDKLHQDLRRITSVVLTSFDRLTVQQDTELRRAIQAAGGRYQVVKNTLAKRAAAETPAASLMGELKGVNSIAYTEGDPVALAKVVTKYAKDNPAFTFRAGLVEGRVVSVDQLQELAALPTHEELLAKLLGLLQAPAQRLAAVVAGPARKLAILLQQAQKEEKFSQAN